MVALPILIFIFGLIIGSFLNVVILRMNTGRSSAKGRSMCMRCSRPLEWHELIPVFSFLMLRGKCRTCKAHISYQYPVVELLTAIAFVLLYIKFPVLMAFSALSWLIFLFGSIVSALLIVAAVYDGRHKILPDAVIYPFLLLAIARIAVGAVMGSIDAPLQALVDGVLVGLPFFLLWAFSKGKLMGFGDVKLALGIGWLLGLSGGYAAVIFSFWIGAIFGLFLIALTSKHSMKSQIPFGPFLIAATLIVVLWGDAIRSFLPLWG